MTDTHTHLYIPEDFPGQEADQAVERAIAAGIHTLIMPNVDRHSIRPITELRARHPHNIYTAMGLHPTEVTDNVEQDLDIIKKHLEDPGVVGIGEIGMDLHEDTTGEKLQAQTFATQLGWANDKGLPVIIHQRAALPHTLEILSETDLSDIPAIVFHCFTEGPDSVRAIRAILPDAYFGIGGVVTFKNAPLLRQALHEIGPASIVLETDAPWLAPVPQRGTRNESANIPHILEAISRELNIPLQDLEAQTDANARRLFPRIPHP